MVRMGGATVTMPQLPPKPDVVLLVDRTGSMGGAIDKVKANIADVITTVEASQPDARFAVAQHCVFGDPAPAFQVLQDLTGDDAAVVAAVDSIALCDGGNLPEAQLNALWEIGSGAIGFRPDSSQIVAWFGDAAGHYPCGGHTEAAATAALQQVRARVVAVSVGVDRLDAIGQATRITAPPPAAACSPEWGPTRSRPQPRRPQQPRRHRDRRPLLRPLALPAPGAGSPDRGQETVTVSETAATGTLTCQVGLTLNGVAGGPELVQTIHVDLGDADCARRELPARNQPAGAEPGATNEDGYYRMVATDNVDPDVEIYVRDTASNLRLGPYASGTTFKFTQAPGGKVDVKPFTGDVQAKFTLNGDAARRDVMAQDPTAIGRLAGEIVFARLAGDDSPFECHVVQTRLVRGSGEIPPRAR
jgi:hypothetical protein